MTWTTLNPRTWASGPFTIRRGSFGYTLRRDATILGIYAALVDAQWEARWC